MSTPAMKVILMPKDYLVLSFTITYTQVLFVVIPDPVAISVGADLAMIKLSWNLGSYSLSEGVYGVGTIPHMVYL
jgi:hypothetical protein